MPHSLYIHLMQCIALNPFTICILQRCTNVNTQQIVLFANFYHIKYLARVTVPSTAAMVQYDGLAIVARQQVLCLLFYALLLLPAKG